MHPSEDLRATSEAASADGCLLLADGRSLAYRTFGDPAGRPVIALHGTPGSRLKFSAADEPARRLGLRLVAPDRWAYGRTSAHPAPSLAAFAGDMAALADRLGLAAFAVMGVSGGGPFAAATAALLPARVTALALVAPVGPMAGEDRAGVSAFHRFCFGPLARRPRAVGAVFGAFRGALGLWPRLGLRLGMLNVPRADRQVLATGDVAARLARTFSEGLRPGAGGPVIDLALFGAPWQVPLGDACMPARLWLGTADRNVPLVAAHRLAARLGRCETVTLEGEGHLWVALNYAEVLAWIAATWPAAQN
jgi:pimeloyl-ACP methyl ester carboxylesterase